jgi:nucleoside-diphosphate-sugar epimerase
MIILNSLKKTNTGMIKRILVTGGGGYIGAVLVPMLIKEGFSVTVLDNFLSGKKLTENDSLKLITGDIQNIQTVSSAVKNSDLIVHLAGISDGRAGKKNPELTRKINLDAFKNLIQIASDSGVKTLYQYVYVWCIRKQLHM